MAKAVEH